MGSRSDRPYDRENNILLGPMVRNELRITVRSGSLIVRLRSRSTHGPETRNWILAGVARPHDHEDFSWRGPVESETARSWERWTYWAGLEAIAPLQRGMKRG